MDDLISRKALCAKISAMILGRMGDADFYNLGVLSGLKAALDAIRTATEVEKEPAQIVKAEINYYDKEETYENCTVQVLTNTVTGEVSVGWWQNDSEPEAL